MPRKRQDPEQSRAMILDAVDRLMRREGYGAVSTRRVAGEAGLKAPLVHYYYPTTDDLILALYRRSAEQTRASVAAAIASDRPLHALWQVNVDPVRTALAAEFIALANHRKSIRDEIAKNVADFRAIQTAAVGRVLTRHPGLAADPGAEVGMVILAAIGRALVSESSIGVSAGHADTLAFVEKIITQLEPPTADGATPSPLAPAKPEGNVAT